MRTKSSFYLRGIGEDIPIDRWLVTIIGGQGVELLDSGQTPVGVASKGTAVPATVSAVDQLRKWASTRAVTTVLPHRAAMPNQTRLGVGDGVVAMDRVAR